MKIVYYVPDYSNIGDYVVISGIEFIFKNIFNNNSDTHVRHEFATNNFDYIKDADVFVLSGTPWFWDLSHKSAKYARLKEVLSFLPKKCLKIGMGLGSNYPLFWLTNPSLALNNAETNIATKDIYQNFNLIFTRDSLAWYILNSLDIPNYYVPCPSTLSARSYGIEPTLNSSDSLFVLYNAMQGVSKDGFSPGFSYYWDNINKQILEQFKPKLIIGISPKDIDYANYLGIKCQLITTPNGTVSHLLNIINKFKTVISGRIHSAIPAIALKKHTYCLPVDTRILTTSNMGIIPVFNESDLSMSITPYGNQLDISAIQQKYISSIKSIL